MNIPRISVETLDGDQISKDKDWMEVIKTNFPIDELESDEVLHKASSDGIGFALKAKREDETVGVAAIQLLKQPRMGFITYLAVNEKNRGGGIGRILFNAAEKHAKGQFELLNKVYNGTIWEVEKPELAGISEMEKEIRKRRIEFFNKVGGEILQGQEYLQPPLTPFQKEVPFHLMVKRNNNEVLRTLAEVKEVIRAIYLEKYKNINGVQNEILLEMSKLMGL